MLTSRYVNVAMRALTAVPDRDEQAKLVLKASDFSKRLDVPPDESCFKHALRACDRSGSWSRALDMLEAMREAGYTPDVLTYANVMSACARNGRAQTVLRLLADMRAEGLQPNAFCYNAAINACARARRWRQGISIMHEMEVCVRVCVCDARDARE